MKKKWLFIIIALILTIGLINVISLMSRQNSKDVFLNIPEIVKYEPIYKTIFDDKQVIFYQKNNDIYYTVDNKIFRINNLNSRDEKTRFWWSDANDAYYENNELIQPKEIFDANDRKIAIYNLDSKADIYVVYADEKAKEYLSYIVENTICTQKTIDYKKIEKFVSQLSLLNENDSVNYTFTPKNPIAVIFRFPYHRIDFVNSMSIDNTYTFTLSTSGEQKGILEFEDRTDTTKNSYFELTDQQITEFKNILNQ